MRVTNTVLLVGGPYNGKLIDIVDMRKQIHMQSNTHVNKEVYQLLDMNFMNETGAINTYFYAYAKEADSIEMDDFLYALVSAYASSISDSVSSEFFTKKA